MGLWRGVAHGEWKTRGEPKGNSDLCVILGLRACETPARSSATRVATAALSSHRHLRFRRCSSARLLALPPSGCLFAARVSRDIEVVVCPSAAIPISRL